MASRRDEQTKLIADQQATIGELRAIVADLRAMLETIQETSSAREAPLQAKLDALLLKAFGKSSEKMPSPAKDLRKDRSPKLVASAGRQKRKR